MPTDLFLVRHGESEGNVALNAAKAGDRSYLTEDYLARTTLDYRLSPEGARARQHAQVRGSGHGRPTTASTGSTGTTARRLGRHPPSVGGPATLGGVDRHSRSASV